MGRFYVEVNEKNKTFDIVEIVTFNIIESFRTYTLAKDQCRVLNLQDKDRDKYINELLKFCKHENKKNN